MNKLYILGALALANVEASISLIAIGTTPATVTGANIALASTTVGGTYSYAYTGDCIASTTLTTLGMNNIYHQYYYFAMSKGTAIFSSIGTPYLVYIPAITVILTSFTNTYNGCWHSHIYNWMAQPTLSSTAVVTSVTAGFGNSVVGYGYAMVGTATTSCVAATIVSTILFVKSAFLGAQYQTSIMTVAAGGIAVATAIPLTVWGKVGPGNYVAKVQAAGTATIALITAGLSGVGLAISQNAYWDFMQTNVIQGATTLGRGGGALGTGPCGWYVGYFYESPSAGITVITDTMNNIDDSTAPYLNIWTDNSVVKAASAFVIAGLAGLLF